MMDLKVADITKRKMAKRKPITAKSASLGPPAAAAAASLPYCYEVDESLLRKNYEIAEGACGYFRHPRLLPDIAGICSLSKAETKRDLRQMEIACGEAFSTQESKDDLLSIMSLKKKRSRSRPPNLMPEEVIATLPSCRKAVYVTKQEFMKASKERNDLERHYMQLRCQLIYQLNEMQKEKDQHDQVLGTLRMQIKAASSSLEARKRRNSSLQNLLMELEHRGDAIENLTCENERLRMVLEKHGIEAEEAKGCILQGDIVDTPFGTAAFVKQVRNNGIVEVDVDGCTAFFQANEVAISSKTSEGVKASIEEKMRSRLFDQASALLDAVEQLRDEGNDTNDEAETDSNNGDSGRAKKRQLIDFTACSIRTTPENVPLLLSPLSELPDKVAAYGPNALHWMASSLPQDMREWEDDKLRLLQQQGDIERLKFKVAEAEASQKECYRQMADQRDAINHLVGELQKARSENPSRRDRASKKTKREAIDTRSSPDLSDSDLVKETTENAELPEQLNRENGSPDISITSLSAKAPQNNISQVIEMATQSSMQATLTARRSLRPRAKSPMTPGLPSENGRTSRSKETKDSEGEDKATSTKEKPNRRGSPMPMTSRKNSDDRTIEKPTPKKANGDESNDTVDDTEESDRKTRPRQNSRKKRKLSTQDENDSLESPTPGPSTRSNRSEAPTNGTRRATRSKRSRT